MTAAVLDDRQAVELLAGMVAIPSVSGSEKELANHLSRRMSELGFTRSFVDEAGNAVGIMGEGPRQVVLLGHIDTVPGEVPQRTENGCLYGRGAVDAKGPFAAFVSAVARVGPRAGWTIAVVGAVEEEAPTSKGARFAATQFAPEACVIGEPSSWDALTLGYKGRLYARYELVQPLGHSAGPDRAPPEYGVEFWNAIQSAAADFNQGREKLFEQLHPSLVDFRTAGDGLHQTISLAVSFRTPLDFDGADWERRLREWAGEAELHIDEFVPAWMGGKQNPLVRAFLPAIRAKGGQPAFKAKTGTADLNIVGPAWRCPILAYGPGDSKLDHTPNEHIVIEDFLKSVRVLERTLETLCEASPLSS